MKEPMQVQEDVARALRMLGQALPPDGMEARIAGRLRQRQAELSACSAARGNLLRKRWIFATAMLVVAVVIALLGLHPADRAVPVSRASSRASVQLPYHAAPSAPAEIVQASVPVNVASIRRRSHVVAAPDPRMKIFTNFRNPPLLPLTHQEKLLLALAQTPSLAPSFITTSETIVDHGLGKNAILELDHQEPKELTPLKTTLQLTQLKSTLPQPNLLGEIE
jgi:hypothetical protein